jgi:hypothetical protein
LTDNFSFGWEAFNNITKDAKGNFLQLGWEKIWSYFLEELQQQWLVRF